jgi:hypothetical protein
MRWLKTANRYYFFMVNKYINKKKARKEYYQVFVKVV